MKRVSLFVILVLCAYALAGVRNYSATLKVANEVASTPIDSTANGVAQIKINDTAFTFEGFIQANNLTTPVVGYHIHRAAVGVNGPIVADLASFETSRKTAGRSVRLTFKGTITDKVINSVTVTRQEVIDAIKSGNAYVNVHTETYPGGEIRGQVR